MKRWIITARMKACNETSCDEYGMPDACRITNIFEDGGFIKVCKTCKKEVRCTEGYQRSDKFKDRRACKNPKCRHVRDVTVSLFGARHMPGSNAEESYEQFCDACKLEQSAAVHFAQAKKFVERAKQIRAKRKTYHDTESPPASTEAT